MSDQAVQKTVTVVNPQGLHARPAYILAELAGRFDAKVELVKDNERVDGKSILSIMTLAAEKGSQICIEASGPDAEAAVEAIAKLVEQGFPGGAKAETAKEKS